MKHKKICIITLICAIVAIVARFIALLEFTEASTGFIKKDYGAAAGQVICAVITILAFVIPFLLCRYKSKRQPTQPLQIKKFPVMMIACWFMAAAMLVLSAAALLSGGVTGLLGGVIYLLAALFFIIYAVSYFTGKPIAPFLTFFPIIAMVYKLVELFISYNGVTTIIENAYDLIFLCVALYFFLLHGRITARASIRSSSRKIFAVGMLGALLSVSCTVPYYLIILFGKSAALHSTHYNFDYLLIGIYMAVYTLCLFSKASLPLPKKKTPSVTLLDTKNDEKIMPSTDFYMSDKTPEEDEKFPGLTHLEDGYKSHEKDSSSSEDFIVDNGTSDDKK